MVSIHFVKYSDFVTVILWRVKKISEFLCELNSDQSVAILSMYWMRGKILNKMIAWKRENWQNFYHQIGSLTALMFVENL